MRRRRRSTWLVVAQSDDSFDVTLGNRPVVTGLRSLPVALHIVRSSRKDGDKAYLVEEDNYRTPIKA